MPGICLLFRAPTRQFKTNSKSFPGCLPKNIRTFASLRFSSRIIAQNTRRSYGRSKKSDVPRSLFSALIDPLGRIRAGLYLQFVAANEAIPSFLGAHGWQRARAARAQGGLAGANAAMSQRIGFQACAFSCIAFRRDGDADL